MIAVFTLSLAIALKSSPRNRTSSTNPTQSIHQGGTHTFRFSSDGLMDVSLISKCEGEMKDIPSFDKSSAADGNEIIYAHSYQQGDIITLRARVKRINATVSFHVQWMTPSTVRSNASMDALLWQAKQADAVIYCGGLNHSLDCEGFDRQSMTLPEEQDKLIPLLLQANPNTIVVITAGSPVTMPWLPQAKAVLWSWYAGMEGGHALADILFGAASPSGKLPFTLPVQYSDTPVSRYGEYQAGTCRYNEGILVGYRGYDQDGITPMFPFGHGLSYAEFAYRDLVTSQQDDGVLISFTITNTGHVPSAETVQLYIGDPVASVMRPPKELKGFQKVWLQPDESKTVAFMVSTRDLSFYDERSQDFVCEPGKFTAMIGSSSRDIRLTGTFEMEA